MLDGVAHRSRSTKYRSALLICFDQSQFSCEIPTLVNQTKDVLHRVLSFVDHWRNEVTLYTNNLEVRNSIRSLFKHIITLSGVAKIHARQHWWERLFKAAAPNAVHPYVLKLQSSVELVGRALVSAVGYSRFCHCLDLHFCFS